MHLKISDMDMLHGSLAGKLLLFTLPIALSSMVQQLFNAADTAVAGHFGSANALVAVGTNTEIIALIVTVSSGLSIGANVLIAKHVERNEAEKLPAAVQTAMRLAMCIGVIGLLLGQIAAAPLLRLIRTPEEIFDAAALYLRIYMLGYPFLLLYDFGAACLRARGDSRYPFLALLLSGFANVGLNLLFTAGLRMGVAGVAIATDLSTMLSAFLVQRRLAKDAVFRFAILSQRSARNGAWSILKTGIPSAVQGAVFCFANIFVQASVNCLGADAIAGSTIAMNFEYVTYYIITAFGQTATTFTSQNHAAGEFGRCRRILRLCLGLSLLCSTVPFFAIVLFEIRSRGFLRRMLRSFRTQACGFCASCSLSRCAICMKYRRAFCATAGMRCIRRSARWLERAHFASPGFTQSSGQNRPSRCSTMRFLFHGQRRLC